MTRSFPAKNTHVLFLFLVLFFVSQSAYAQPVADFSSNKTTGCVPLGGVNFTDLSTGGTVVNRRWDLGNGTIIPNGPAVVGTNYLNDGTFTVKLTVTFSGGEVLSAEKKIVVHPKPVVKFSASVTEGCIPLNTQFKDESTTATGTITDHVWDFGAAGSTAANPSFSYTANGTYNVSLLVTNSWGCASDAVTVPAYIKVYPRPQASFSIPVNASCNLPFTANFVNNTSGDGTITYNWDLGNGNTSTEREPSATYTTAGVYRVRLTAQNGPGCTSTYTAPTEIYAGTPEVTINAAATACTNTAVPFTAAVTPAAFGHTYKWTFSDNGTIRTGQSPSYTFTNPGTYKVFVEATNQAGCKATAEHEITVRSAPSAAFAADKTVSCQFPFAVQFTPDVVSPDVSYSWTFGDGQTSTETAPQHTYMQTGYFTVRLQTKDISIPDGCTTTETKSSYIRIQRPTVDFTYTPPAGCRPLPVKFTARVNNLTELVANYTWIFGDGNTVTVTNPEYTHIYNNAGNFQAKLIIQTVSGCTEESILKPVAVAALCDDDGSGGGGGGGGAGFGVGKSCTDKYTVTFTNTEPDTEVLSWNFGDGSPLYNTAPLENVTHSFPNTGKEYIVTITRRHIPSGQVYDAQKRVIIIDEKADFEPDLTDICAGKTVQFTPRNINAANISTYTWDFGDGSTPRVINNLAYFNAYGIYLDGKTSYTYNNNGTFPVTLTITDKLGCTDVSTFTSPISVKAPEAAFSPSLFTTCDENFDVVFTDASIPNGSTPIVAWEWNFGDGQTLNRTDDASVQHSFSNQSFYREFNARLRVRDQIGCENEVTHLVKSYRPKANFSSADVLTCGKYTISFSNNSSARNATYQWEYGDNTTATGYAPSHTYAVDGDYTIRLTATDENGCVATEEKPAYIRLVKPQADFTVDGDDKCAPVALVLKDNSTFASSYSWDFGDGGTGTSDKNPSPHIYAVPGFYDITLRVKGVGGCESSITKKVRVKGPIGNLTTGPALGCAPFNFNMQVTGSNITTYAWDFGDGTPVNPSTSADKVAHIYPSYGQYLPNVILSSPEGCQYTLKMTDPVVVDDALASFSINRNNFCDTAMVNISNNSFFPFGNQGSFQWKFGDGTFSTDAAPGTHSYNKPGSYTIQLIATSINGCRNEMALAQPIHIATPPQLSIAGSMEQCAGETRSFEAGIVSEDKVTGYQWLLDDQPAATDAPFVQRFPTAGVYELGLAVQTQHGCLDTLFKEYTVHRLPVPAASPNTTICIGTGVSLHATDGIKYEWNPATPLDNAAIATPFATPLTDTRFTVKVTNEFGCTQEESITIKVDERVALKVSDDAVICLGDRVRLSASGNTDQFLWTPANGLSDPAVARPFASPVVTTRYTVTGFSKNVCPDETGSVTVTVGSIPTVDLGPDREVAAGTRITLAPVVSQDVVRYEWTPSTGLTCTDCKTPQFNADKTITYRLRVKTQYDCEASDAVNIKVLCGADAVYIPNGFTPNGDGHNDVFFIKGFGIRLVKKLQVFDRWGQVVYSVVNIAPNDASKGWKGTVKGKMPQSNATFVYVVEAECHEGGTILLKGTVTVVR